MYLHSAQCQQHHQHCSPKPTYSFHLIAHRYSLPYVFLRLCQFWPGRLQCRHPFLTATVTLTFSDDI
jgi:hypothetical protein